MENKEIRNPIYKVYGLYNNEKIDISKYGNLKWARKQNGLLQPSDDTVSTYEDYGFIFSLNFDTRGLEDIKPADIYLNNELMLNTGLYGQLSSEDGMQVCLEQRSSIQVKHGYSLSIKDDQKARIRIYRNDSLLNENNLLIEGETLNIILDNNIKPGYELKIFKILKGNETIEKEGEFIVKGHVKAAAEVGPKTFILTFGNNKKGESI